MRYTKKTDPPQSVVVSFGSKLYRRSVNHKMTDDGLDNIAKTLKANFEEFLKENNLKPERRQRG